MNFHILLKIPPKNNQTTENYFFCITGFSFTHFSRRKKTTAPVRRGKQSQW